MSDVFSSRYTEFSLLIKTNEEKVGTGRHRSDTVVASQYENIIVLESNTSCISDRPPEC